MLQEDDGEVERFTETFVRSFLLGLGAGAILETLHVTSKVLPPMIALPPVRLMSIRCPLSGGAPLFGMQMWVGLVVHSIPSVQQMTRHNG